MNRKNCTKSRNEDPNWLEKVETELSQRFIEDSISIILLGSRKVLEIKDSYITNNNATLLSYSCEIIKQ